MSKDIGYLKSGIAPYIAKRNFERTPEPQGGALAAGHRFVVQHHWAKRDHYDFRLEMSGVLKSWAVTRGPSANPKDKRLAVRTEDHPLDYADFEGNIPAGEYGGGTVMLWDEGEWISHDADPQKALDLGIMKFALSGRRMQGNWTLIRMKPKVGESAGRENWLLIKERDDHMEPDAGLLDHHTTSVRSGRSREAIAQGDAPIIAAFPDFYPPCLCRASDGPPEGPGWLHELKYDGYRLQIGIGKDNVRLLTREGHDWSSRFPAIASDARQLDVQDTVIDGEAVVFDARGVTDFVALVAALDGRGQAISFVAFDLLITEGRDIRKLPLEERKAQLKALLNKKKLSRIRYADHVDGEGAEMFGRAIAGGAEGIVSKRAASPYGTGRTGAWIKIKGIGREDFAIVGWLPSKNSRPFSALLLAQTTDDGHIFVGRVGTGFSARQQAVLLGKLQPLQLRAVSPDLRGLRNIPLEVNWVDPILSASVAFAGWTGENQLRHARFLELRTDLTPIKTTEVKIVKTGQQNAAPLVGSKPPARLTHPDKILFPDIQMTKAQLAQFYDEMAPRILPHLKGRPVSFLRAPEGINEEMFFQRHALKGMNEGIAPIEASSHGKKYITIAGKQGLLTAAQFSVVELHGWAATSPNLEYADRIIFDLDPDISVAFSAVKAAAMEIRDVLSAAGLTSFPLLSGGKGIHVVAPLDRHNDWDEVERFTQGLARKLVELAPTRYVAVATKTRRKGRIFIDYLRNKSSATAIVPYSLRAREGAPVAMPVDWEGLDAIEASNQFNVNTSLSAKIQPWANFFDLRQNISRAAIKMVEFIR